MISVAVSGRASTRLFIRRMSTIDVSSNTNTSPGSGFDESNVNFRVCGLYFSSRCTVCEAMPVDSARRFAARPVGAAVCTMISGLPFASRRAPNISTKARMMVVFPTPGPPVMMLTLLSSDVRTALSCAGAKRNPVFASHHAIARSGSIGAKRGLAAMMRFSLSATLRSAQ